MALAVVNLNTCLPFVGAELGSSDKKYECQYCVDECTAAGYNAIEFMRVGTQVDEEGAPIEDSGYIAPVVLPELCVGCGLCQTRCFAMNVKKTDGLLKDTAILIEAGAGKEDRMMSGSYVALRDVERKTREEEQRELEKALMEEQGESGGDGYLPDFLK